MTDARRAAFLSGVLFGTVLIFVDAMALRFAGAVATGALLIRLWATSQGLAGTDIARIGIIAGLVMGVTRQFLLLILMILGVFFDPTPALMQPPSDTMLYEFQQAWGYDYYTVHVLFDVLGGAVGAAVGALLTTRIYDTDTP